MAYAYEACGEPILSVRNLEVSLKTSVGELKATRGISFDICPGETFAIVGESGCGKSISSMALMGLLPRIATARADRCVFDGQEILNLSRRKLSNIRGNTLSMIFQDPMTSLNPVYTIGDQLTEVFLRHGKGNRKQARERAVFLLERVGIKNAAERLGAYPHQLSGGLRQRVVIAMAMMCRPKLIIADEPTTALDVTVQMRTLALLAELQREFGLAIILITHDLGVVASLSDRVAVMYAGQIVETAPTRQLFADPTHPYTQGLIQCIPSYEPPNPDAELHTIPGMVPSLIGKQRGCAFRNRCSLAVDACGEGDEIALRELGEGHAYRCLQPHDALVANWRLLQGESA
ncbi:ABC transporter ATP-binding protein [Hoeflea alexandrii]|uniref:ABC transporter ATP-binding protein n=1 Tax=Hoeflea alexandrii TaxID=288436 RepID=UPI0022B02267|nr:ABC transporter ATP-binding protein [Hoeflea alexandrii]MCZ4291598.1 ABC transporter ATP-binding protein [Hoeflea alexandrii]